MQNFINRFFFILPASPKQLVILVILFVVMSVLEAFGIGMIGPFLNLASHPNLVNESEFVASIYAGLNLTEASHGIALLGLFIIALFAIKSFLNWQIKTYVFGFCLKVRGKLCEKLIQEYLSVPYTFHLSKDSAAVIQCIIIYTQAFALDILMLYTQFGCQFNDYYSFEWIAIDDQSIGGNCFNISVFTFNFNPECF
ncbi:hypothetical protein AB3M80_00880 [Arthrospira platensis BEA 1257B]